MTSLDLSICVLWYDWNGMIGNLRSGARATPQLTWALGSMCLYHYEKEPVTDSAIDPRSDYWTE